MPFIIELIQKIWIEPNGKKYLSDSDSCVIICNNLKKNCYTQIFRKKSIGKRLQLDELGKCGQNVSFLIARSFGNKQTNLTKN